MGMSIASTTRYCSRLADPHHKPHLGLMITALAMATRCFWPPDSRTPRSPTIVW